MNRKLQNNELGRPNLDKALSIKKLPLVVMLDNVRSMANVGSVFRTCDAFGVSELVLAGITPTPPHREIQKTALGATDSVKWVQKDDPTIFIESLKREGYNIYSVEQTEKTIEPQLMNHGETQGICLILGNEVNGVNQSLIDLSDAVIEIHQYGIKHSLNVSVAAGIVIWEAYKLLSA